MKNGKRPPKQKLERSLEGRAFTVGDLLEVLCAVHLSSYVEGPFADRGGLMLIGAPGTLRSTFLSLLDKNYSDAVSMSDINSRALADLREQIAAKTIRTLVLPEYAKLWERHPYTSRNVEGTFRALVGEGFTAPSFEDQRINRLRARCTILSAITPTFQTLHFREWEESGFNRRFLWSLLRLKDPLILDRAVEEWQLVDFRLAHIPPAPMAESIPNLTTVNERKEMRRLVKYQPGGSHVIQTALLSKILAVLKWWYRSLKRTDRDAMATVRAFAATLGKEGAELVI